MEKLLHYVWKHRIFPLKILQTQKGDEIEILDPGIPNADAGPDFFNAKIKIGGTVWIGNVEIHVHASDWFQHGHHLDACYNNVILHVVEKEDAEIYTANGKTPVQLALPIPQSVREHYHTLKVSKDYPRCYEMIPSLDRFLVHSWMSALVYERLETRAGNVLERVKKGNGDWENAFFITLARNMGFGLNGDAFEHWAQRISLNAIGKHRDNLLQIEAFFMGQAGLLETAGMDENERKAASDDAYFRSLNKEYAYLRHKFNLQPMDASKWKLMRTRPYNFPHIRLSQLAMMFHQEQLHFSIIKEITELNDLRRKLQMNSSEYWENHCTFGFPSLHRTTKRMGRNSADLLIINTIIPSLFAYGSYIKDNRYSEQAIELLEQLPAENNHIIRMWQECGLEVSHAADSQSLIQLKKEYCDRHECLRCRFGYEYLCRYKQK